MKTTKPEFLTTNDWNLLLEKYDNIDEIVDKLNNNYPVQYLIGNVNFYGYDIDVTEDTLIPRFETEGLIEKTLEYINKYNLSNLNVLDIGTGSGCIDVVLKSEVPSLNITSIDISDKALKVAKSNIDKYNLDINLINEDIFKYKPNNKYDIIISNPPYISEDEIIDPKCSCEPNIALYAPNKGLSFYEHIIKTSINYLNEKYLIAFEIGYTQGEYLKEYASIYHKNATIEILKDLSGKDRYLFIINE